MNTHKSGNRGKNQSKYQEEDVIAILSDDDLQEINPEGSTYTMDQ